VSQLLQMPLLLHSAGHDIRLYVLPILSAKAQIRECFNFQLVFDCAERSVECIVIVGVFNHNSIYFSLLFLGLIQLKACRCYSFVQFEIIVTHNLKEIYHALVISKLYSRKFFLMSSWSLDCWYVHIYPSNNDQLGTYHVYVDVSLLNIPRILWHYMLIKWLLEVESASVNAIAEI
jgi:hypothetical protein